MKLCGIILGLKTITFMRGNLKLNIKKRIFPIVLFFALIASEYRCGAKQGKCCGRHGWPCISERKREWECGLGGESVTVSVTATDDSSGVKRRGDLVRFANRVYAQPCGIIHGRWRSAEGNFADQQIQ